jgi:signal transduction histidine kinase
MRPQGPLSVRARLLTGLVTLTAVFLVVMGAVSTIVLGRLEKQQFDDGLLLTARSSVFAIQGAPSQYIAAIVSSDGQVTELTGGSRADDELHAFLTRLVAAGGWENYLRSRQGTVFGISLPGGPGLRAATRTDVAVHPRTESADLVPPGQYAVIVARPASEATSHARELVLAEIVTGAALLALVLIGGRWLIGRGLAPLDRMASTADMITSRGDLAARMPDPGDNAEAGRLARAINTMLDQIQQAFTARLHSEQKVRQFAADASHELRTPLTTIRGYAELYRAGALGPEDLPNAMRRIEQESDRMSSLVAELLELARLDRDSSLDLTDTDLAEIVRDAVADAKAVEPDRQVRAQAPPHLVMEADEPRIRQVLANLLGNVRAHTPPGTPAKVRLSEAFDGALIEVADSGPGMAPADAARAFDRFHRGASRAAGTGSGLGLSIVQAIATAHGGHARMLSVPGEGTTVQVWIPAHHSERPATAPSGSDANEPAGGQSTRTPYISPRGSASNSTRAPSGSRK